MLKRYKIQTGTGMVIYEFSLSVSKSQAVQTAKRKAADRYNISQPKIKTEVQNDGVIKVSIL